MPELVPGVRKMLARLDATYTLGNVTSGSKSRVVKDVHRLDIHEHFKTIVTGDDVREPKPSPESLVLALNDISISPDEAVYVGDAHADFEMAKAAGVAFFGVPSEFASLSPNHPEHEIHQIASLVDVIRER